MYHNIETSVLHWGDFNLKCARIAYVSQRPVLVEGDMNLEPYRQKNDEELDEMIRAVLAIGFNPVYSGVPDPNGYIDPRACKDQTEDYVLPIEEPKGVLYHARMCRPRDTSCSIWMPEEGNPVVGIKYTYPTEEIPHKLAIEGFVSYCVIEKVLHRAGFTPIKSHKSQIPPEFLKGFGKG